jgi:hypothetical protein
MSFVELYSSAPAAAGRLKSLAPPAALHQRFPQHRLLRDMRFFRRQVTVEASCLRLSAYVDAQRLA